MSEAKIVLSAEDRTKAAFESVKRNLGEVNELARFVGVSFASLGTAATLGGLAAMVRSAVNSVDAFNDLKDATGASIENISALENVARRTGANFETVSTSLVKFNQALGQTAKPGSDAEKVLKAIGLNAQELRNIDPAEALHKTAIALSQFADDGNKARAVQELFGKSLKEVAPFLKDLAEAGKLNATVTTKQAEEAEKFNKELFRMRTALDDVGRTIANPVITNVNKMVDMFRMAKSEGRELSEVLGAMRAFATGGVIGGWRHLTRDARNEPQERLRETLGELEDVRNRIERSRLRQRPSTDIGAQHLLRREAELIAQRNAMWGNQLTPAEATDALSRNPLRNLNLPPEKDKEAEARAKAAAAATLKEAQRVAEERQKLRIKESEEIEKFFQQQEELARKAAEAQILLQQKLFAAYEDSEQKAFASIIAKTDVVKAEIEGNGLLRSEVESLTLVRLEDMKVAMAAGGEDLESINARIQAQQTLIGLYKNREVQEANTKAAEAAQKEWAQVGQSLTDSLMRGGRSAAQYLKDLFRTLVLRPMLAPFGQAVTGMLGGPVGGAGTGVGGGLGDLFGQSMAGFNQGMGATFQNGLIGGFGANMSNIGTLVEGGSYGAAIGSAMPYAGIIAAAASGKTGAAAGMAIGSVFGPIGMAVGAIIGGLVDSKKGGPKTDSGAGFGVAQIGDPAAAMASVNAIQQAYSGMVGSLGGSDRGLQVGVFSSQDPRGTAKTILDVDAGMGGQKFYDRQWRMGNVENVGRSPEELQAAMAEEVNRVLLGALQRSDVPGILGDWLRSLGDAAKMSAKSVEEAIARLQKASAEKKTLDDVWFQMTHTAAEVMARDRKRELEALDLTNRAQMVRIHALQDEIGKQQLAQAVFAQASEEIAQLKLNLGGYVDRLNATPAGLLAPEQQLANAKAQFAIQLASAKAGNRNAMQGITGYADQLISAQVGYTASGTDTANTIAYVKQALTDLPDLLSAEQIVAQSVQDGSFLLNATMEQLIARVDAGTAATVAAITGQAQAENAALAASTGGASALAGPQHGAEAQDLIAIVNANQGGGWIKSARRNSAVVRLRALGVPGYAEGGDYSGGFVHMVGERGPELRAGGAARYWSAEQTARMVGGGDQGQVVQAINRLEARLDSLVVISAQGARGTIDGLGVVAGNTEVSARAAQLKAAEAPV